MVLYGFDRLSIQWSKWIGDSEFYSYGRFVLLDDSECHVIACEEEVCEDSLTPADQFARHTRSHGQKALSVLWNERVAVRTAGTNYRTMLVDEKGPVPADEMVGFWALWNKAVGAKAPGDAGWLAK